jgi:hypothetical protein
MAKLKYSVLFFWVGAVYHILQKFMDGSGRQMFMPDEGH